MQRYSLRQWDGVWPTTHIAAIALALGMKSTTEASPSSTRHTAPAVGVLHEPQRTVNQAVNRPIGGTCVFTQAWVWGSPFGSTWTATSGLRSLRWLLGGHPHHLSACPLESPLERSHGHPGCVGATPGPPFEEVSCAFRATKVHRRLILLGNNNSFKNSLEGV